MGDMLNSENVQYDFYEYMQESGPICDKLLPCNHVLSKQIESLDRSTVSSKEFSEHEVKNISERHSDEQQINIHEPKHFKQRHVGIRHLGLKPVLSRRKRMRRKKLSVPGSLLTKCSACSIKKPQNKTCSCPEGHRLCQQCIQQDVQGMLLGEEKASKIHCHVHGCRAYLSNDELSKVVPKFMIQLLEKKIFKEYLQYIKNWLLTSHGTKLQSFEDFAIAQTAFQDEVQEGWPKYWVPMTEGQQTTVYVVEHGCEEFVAQTSCFHQYMKLADFEIINLFRIQNPILWKFYSLKKSQMLLECTDKENLEKLLYHGTQRNVVGTIVEKGFDWRLCGKNATVYGQGTYFAKSAELSHCYTICTDPMLKRCFKCWNKHKDGQKKLIQIPPTLTVQSDRPVPLKGREMGNPSSIFVRDPSVSTNFMFVANVLVGQYTRGYSFFRRPPPVDRSKPHGKLFDSCVDHETYPQKFVIFDHTQAYPMYVLEYTKRNNR